MRERFNNLLVGRKLLMAFAVIVVLYSITVIAAVVSIQDMTDRMSKLYEEPFENVETSLGIKSDIQTAGRLLALMAATEDSIDEESTMTEAKELIKQVASGIKQLSTGYISDQENMDELLKEFELLKDPRDKVLSLLEKGQDQEALEAYFSEYEPQAKTVRSLLSDAAAAASKDAQNTLKKGKAAGSSIILIMLALAAVCIFFTVILWLVITRSVVKPVNEVKKAANAIANGQLDTQVTYKSKNELGQLADDIRATAFALQMYVSEIRKSMAALGNGKLSYHSDMDYRGDFVAVGDAIEEIGRMLRESMQQISISAEQVSGGAEQVSNGAQTLARGASEQASSIEELAVSINEIADSVKENAENAVRSSKLADLVGTSISESNQQMQSLTEAIREVKENSDEITGIVKEIEDIAFQTNILALNASVEAARAGEAGRGFSVVAGEVRRLASKTSGASKLTGELVEKNSRTVEAGMDAVNATKKMFKESAKGAQEVNHIVDKISEASVQQADAIAQIRKSVELISEIVQGNSATSEESAAASEELSAQAQVLKELVEQFEV